MPLFLMGCFPVDSQEVKRPLGAKSEKRPIKVGKRPIKEGKRPIKAMVLVGISVGCLMGCFRAPPPWPKTAPLKGPLRGLVGYVSRIWGGKSQLAVPIFANDVVKRTCFLGFPPSPRVSGDLPSPPDRGPNRQFLEKRVLVCPKTPVDLRLERRGL